MNWECNDTSTFQRSSNTEPHYFNWLLASFFYVSMQSFTPEENGYEHCYACWLCTSRIRQLYQTWNTTLALCDQVTPNHATEQQQILAKKCGPVLRIRSLYTEVYSWDSCSHSQKLHIKEPLSQEGNPSFPFPSTHPLFPFVLVLLLRQQTGTSHCWQITCIIFLHSLRLQLSPYLLQYSERM